MWYSTLSSSSEDMICQTKRKQWHVFCLVCPKSELNLRKNAAGLDPNVKTPAHRMSLMRCLVQLSEFSEMKYLLWRLRKGTIIHALMSFHLACCSSLYSNLSESFWHKSGQTFSSQNFLTGARKRDRTTLSACTGLQLNFRLILRLRLLEMNQL